MKKQLIGAVATGMLLLIGIAGLAKASYLTDPTSRISYSGNVVTLHKELSGYANYGAGDHGSDILYTGESGVWNFNLDSLGISCSDFSSATLAASLTLDDHYTVPVADYSITINLLGTNMYSGSTDGINLAHGTPYGVTFLNWMSASAVRHSEANQSRPFKDRK